MKVGPFIVSTLLAISSSGAMNAQSEQHPKPDLSLSESKKISPFPPKDVQVRIEKGHAVVDWTKSKSQKVTKYVIFRGTDDSPLQKIGDVKDPPFVDEKPASDNVKYAVASVDFNDNQSAPRPAQQKAKTDQ